MTLIGCDLHARKQRVAVLDTGTGENPGAPVSCVNVREWMIDGRCYREDNPTGLP